LRNGNAEVYRDSRMLRRRNVFKKGRNPVASRFGPAILKTFQQALDFPAKRISIELSPPIQFRIEWADSQGMSPLLGCRPI
jgi:hypothetical protein